MSGPHVHELRVRCGECDAQGIVFNANYVAYLDVAITELWRDTVGPWQDMAERGLDIVVAAVEVRFRAPARFDDVLELRTRVAYLGRTSIATEVDIVRGDELLVEGRLRHVVVDASSGAKSPMPEWIRTPLESVLLPRQAVDVPELRGDRVVLRPIEPGDCPALRSIQSSPDVSRWWGTPDHDFPLGDEPESTRLAILAEGEVCGLIQFQEENEPDYRAADIDIFLAGSHQGRGLGTDALDTLARHLFEARDHRRLTISPSADNEAAIRSYEKAGFRRYGVSRASGRSPSTGEWEDEIHLERHREPLED